MADQPIDPRTVYGPTPNWTPPPRDDAPAPNQERDWVKPGSCDPRNPYVLHLCYPPPPALEQGAALRLVDDELDAPPVHTVPEPSLLVLLALGGLALRCRR